MTTIITLSIIVVLYFLQDTISFKLFGNKICMPNELKGF